MARVTVEDCVLKVPNRFDLVMLAAQRARDISSGAQLSVDRDNDKNPVVALREIADETVELDVLADSLVKGLQRQVEIDEPEDDLPDFDMPDAVEPLVDQGAESRPESDPLAGDADPLAGEAETPDEPAEAPADPLAGNEDEGEDED